MTATAQRRIEFTEPRETQAERCRRLLAGVPKLTTAVAMTFDAKAAQAAERTAKQ